MEQAWQRGCCCQHCLPEDQKEGPMSETTRTLPLLPLNTGVVLPAMVVTLALETDEAKAAAEAALAGDGHLLLVPYADGHYAKVGPVARADSAGELPTGMN